MDNRPVNDSELEQVTGRKSYDEWKAYLDSIWSLSTSEIRNLILKARSEIKYDPDLSIFEKKGLESVGVFVAARCRSDAGQRRDWVGTLPKIRETLNNDSVSSVFCSSHSYNSIVYKYETMRS